MYNLITLLQDARLTEGVAQHKAQGWARVAEFMGDGLTVAQCNNRWSNYLEPKQRGLRIGNWQPDEVPHPCCYCSNLYRHITAQLPYFLTCLYIAGGAIAGAGATASDPIALEYSEEGHDERVHRLDGHRQGAGQSTKEL